MAVSDELFAVIMKQVQGAYTFGFGEGQKDFSTSRGGQTWFDVERLVADRMRRALEAAEAVRGGDAAPPAGTVPVRVAVALSEKNHIPWVEVVFSDDEEAFQACERMGHYIRSCIATIHAPLPAVPEVGAVVEGVDRG